jgi:hypothetical protein
MSLTKHPMRITIVLLTLFFAAKGLFAQSPQNISAIRSWVQKINRDTGYQTKVLENSFFTARNDASDNGQELTAYYKNVALKKLVFIVGLSYCTKTYEYYFNGDNLVFVFEKEADYPETKEGELDYSRLVPAFERRLYLDNNKIILTKIKGHQRILESKLRSIDILKTLQADLRSIN